jgi:hypothetical protein
MNKIKCLFVFMFFIEINAFGQLTFFDFLSFEKMSYEEIQSALINNHSVIEENKKYQGNYIKECEPKKFKANGCDWLCKNVLIEGAIFSDYPIDIKSEFSKDLKNFNLINSFNSTFSSDYNWETKTGTSFVSLYLHEVISNANCNNILKQDSYTIHVDYQIFDKIKLERFKFDLSKNAVFKEIKRLPGSSEIEVIYQIRRIVKNGFWRGVLIIVQEGKDSYNVKFHFDSILQKA